MQHLLPALLVLLLVALAFAGPDDVNYDESKIPPYTLPEALTMADGTKVTDAAMWRGKRRAEVFELFADQMYGHSFPRPDHLRTQVLEEDKAALSGKATRRQVRVFFSDGDEPHVDVLMYLPNKASGPVPAFVALNFQGNHTICDDPAILKTPRDADEATRAKAEHRWPVEAIVDRGYALATAWYKDIVPDANDFSTGLYTIFYKPGQNRPGDGQWGAIGAWAYGMSCIADVLRTDRAIDANRIIAMGHSRLGKTALWAGASDERFALVISNCSGCGGAALSRRRIGETVARINKSFPHWFCGNFKKYSDNEDALPIDQHELIALIAPRPVLICSAEEDHWADPRGEFLSGRNADPVYALFGLKGIGADDMPPVNTIVGDAIGYRIRPGKHDVLPTDWQAYMDFADRHLGASR
ncbi:MAG: acetylxylan esterase [Planctomycetes bacterium]|nr:acetylxylan esterase [Planctomycetota bacterium]